MSSDATHTAMPDDTRGNIATATAPAGLAAAGEAIPHPPDHLVVEHVLRSEVLRDPILLARLRAVSHAMRSAVAATGREVKNPGYDFEAAKLGFRSTLKHRQSRGRLTRQEYLCQAAASGGHLEELKVLRADGCPWDKWTCAWALKGGHLVVLQWLRSNGCPWDEQTCSRAALGGHLEVLQWARANGCPWDEGTCSGAAYHGHLEVLKWARANCCRWTASTRAEVADLGYIESDGSDDDSLSDDTDKAETSK